jgi:hypothetical protein
LRARRTPGPVDRLAICSKDDASGFENGADIGDGKTISGI